MPDDPATTGDAHQHSRTLTQKSGLAPGGWFRSLTAWIVGGLVLLLLVLTLTGYFGELWWLADLANEWRFQYAWLACVLFIILLLVRAWAWLLLAVIVAGLNLAVVIPWYTADHPEALEDRGRDLRLMSLNVRVSNQDFESILELIDQREPDIVILNEVNREWLRNLRDIGGGFRLIDTPNQGHFGVLVLARQPLDDVEYVKFSDRWSPSIVLSLTLDQQPARIIATHPPAPTGPQTWENRNEHLRELASYVQQQQVPVLVAGDMNVTMWSPHFQMLTSQSGLTDARDGFGVLPTFPAHRWGVHFITPLRIPLDHVLVSEEWTVFDCATGPDVGSDHLPILVDVSLRDNLVETASPPEPTAE